MKDNDTRIWKRANKICRIVLNENSGASNLGQCFERKILIMKWQIRAIESAGQRLKDIMATTDECAEVISQADH